MELEGVAVLHLQYGVLKGGVAAAPEIDFQGMNAGDLRRLGERAAGGQGIDDQELLFC